MGLGPDDLKGNGEGGPKLGLREVLGPLPPGSMGFMAVQGLPAPEP